MKKTITLLITIFSATLSVFSQIVETVSAGLNLPLGMALDGNDLSVSASLANPALTGICKMYFKLLLIKLLSRIYQHFP